MQVGLDRTSRATPTPGLTGQNGVAYLDLLRAGAANLVLIGHANDVFGRRNAIPAGHVGIGIFFLLSGFLILRSSLSRVQRPAPYFQPFMIDRFSRIFTGYVPVLILVAFLNSVLPLGVWGQDGLAIGPAALLGNALMLQNYPVFQVLQRLLGPGLSIRPYNTAEPFWSIPVEFWIYVFFGIALFGLVLRERLGRLPLALGAVSLPVVVWNAAAGGGNGLSVVWLIGAAGGYVWTGGWEGSRRKLSLGLAVALFGAACLIGRGMKTGWDFQDGAMAVCGMLVLLGGLSVAEGLAPLPAPARALCLFSASYSFSLYLVHNTVLIVARQYLPELVGAMAFPLALLAAHVCAFVLYLLFEQHYRQVAAWLKHGRFSPVRLSSRRRPGAVRG